MSIKRFRYVAMQKEKRGKPPKERRVLWLTLQCPAEGFFGGDKITQVLVAARKRINRRSMFPIRRLFDDRLEQIDSLLQAPGIERLQSFLLDLDQTIMHHSYITFILRLRKHMYVVSLYHPLVSRI